MEIQPTEAVLEISQHLSVYMPQGKPAFAAIASEMPLTRLIEVQGKATLTKAVFLLVKDFCSCINVVRNMNEAQMTEAALFLLDECGNFRLQDYVVMFQLAKRGRLPGIKIFDRIDITVIEQILDSYWSVRNEEGKRLRDTDTEEAFKLESAHASSQPKEILRLGDVFSSYKNLNQDERK